MHPVVRAVAVVAIAAVGLSSCAERTVSGLRVARFASLAIAPVFEQAPVGGPDIEIERLRGVLRNANGTDSVVAEAAVEGDSAILEFTNVTVTGDSTSYQLGLQAFDTENELVFEGTQEVKVKPGENTPAAPELEYSADDAEVTAIDIPDEIVELDWAGAIAGDLSCLNRSAKENAVTEKQLTVTGTTSDDAAVNDVRVGWTSRDESVVTVTEQGLVKARCSNKSVYVVARTYLDVVDSVAINVTAPPFALLMTPDSVSLERGATEQLSAVLVDENNNLTPATAATWSSSDETRAVVGETGLVEGLTNGRVLVSAAAAGLSTVGIVQVVRPKAANVKVIPGSDTLAVGMARQYFALALDAEGRVIGDAREFVWSSSDPVVLEIDAKTGIALAKATASSVVITATIDEQSDDAGVRILSTLPPGVIESKVLNGATDAPISGAEISVPGGSAVSASDGSFTLEDVNLGEDVTISADGFVTVKFFDAPAFPNKTLRVRDVPLSPTGGTGTMKGKVVNALTGATISGATVRAFKGLNAGPSPSRPDVEPDITATTTSDGTFTMSASPGAYTFVVSATGYSDGIGVGISVGGITKNAASIIMPPATITGGVIAVLTWGTCGDSGVPCDLDAHLTGPKVLSTTTRFHVYSEARSYVPDDTIVAVDVVDASGPGPEAIWLRPGADPGTYRFYVHDVSNASNGASTALANTSRARVDVFRDNRLVATFFPPENQAGTLWKVFEFDGARIVPVGTITHDDTPSSIP